MDISGKTLQNWEASTKKSNIKSVMEITFSMLAQTVIAALLVSGKRMTHVNLLDDGRNRATGN